MKYGPFEEEQSRSCSLSVIVARLVDLMNDQVSFYKDRKERASQQICNGRLTNFKPTVLKAVVDR